MNNWLTAEEIEDGIYHVQNIQSLLNAVAKEIESGHASKRYLREKLSSMDYHFRALERMCGLEVQDD